MKKFLSIALAILILFSCGNDDEVVPTVDVPTLPPESTFVIDFSIINADDGGRSMMNGNWGRSAVIVTVWSALAAIYTAIPVASFGEAFNHEPTFDPAVPGWVWEYDADLFGSTYHARLESEVSAAGVQWDMFITLDGVYENFNWYSGFSDISGTNGEWTLNAQPQDPISALKIDWNRNADGTTKDLKYTNIVPNDANNGASIFFEITDGNDYNRLYELFQVVEDNTISIEWHKDNKNGRVKDPLFYSDDEYHCWDENLADTDC